MQIEFLTFEDLSCPIGNACKNFLSSVASTSYKAEGLPCLKSMLLHGLLPLFFFDCQRACRHAEDAIMKDIKPDADRETKPSRNRTERPDNGSRGRKEQGPNSGLWKDNPHKRQTLTRHAWIY